MRYHLLFICLVTVMMMLCVAAAALSTFFISPSQGNRQKIPVTGSELFNGCIGEPIPVINSDYEQAVVEQTNRIRAEAGLPPLKMVPELTQSARYHSADMSNDDYFNHNTFDRAAGDLNEVCNTWERIEHFYDNWLALAENIAAGQRVPETAMEGWMNSPDHRHNILSNHYWEIGVGYFRGDGTYLHYWDQNFGRKEGRYPVIIQGEAARTLSPEVNIYIYGEFDEMRLKNNNGEWSPWMPFQTSFTWQLPPVEGDHRVTVEMKNGLELFSSTDTIELTSSASVPPILSGLFGPLVIGGD